MTAAPTPMRVTLMKGVVLLSMLGVVAVLASLVPFLVLAYGPIVLWLAGMFYLGWRVPTMVAPKDSLGQTFAARFILGAVVMTVFSLASIYAMSVMQMLTFNGDDWQWPEPKILLAAAVVFAPMVYVPLLGVRLFQLWRREPAWRGGAA